MDSSSARYKVAIVAPTCFYFQVALFRELAAHQRIDLTVYFCSDEALYARDVVKMFKTNEQWGGDEDLLEGYKSKFLKNYSPFPSYLSWPFGLMNFGIWGQIKRDRPDVVILMSWTNLTWWVATLACLTSKIPFLYMTDTNIMAEAINPKWKVWPKRLLLAKGLFRLASGFLYAGTANKLLYKSYGVPDEKLVPFAFSWHYASFLKAANEIKSRRATIRRELGISEQDRVILFCGRLIKAKSPLDLVKAYQKLNSKNKKLIFVGDGILKETLRSYVKKNNVSSVRFEGFKNRKEIPNYYAAADVFVLPSIREATGMVVNEAMCFGLPVVVSDQVGFGKDLVLDGDNGFRYPVGDVEALADKIKRVIEMPEEERLAMGIRSRDLIEAWSQRDLAESLVPYLDSICSHKGSKTH